MENKDNVEGFLAFLQKNYEAQVICRGVTSGYNLCMDGGYDVGEVHIKDGGSDYELTYWNEMCIRDRVYGICRGSFLWVLYFSGIFVLCCRGLRQKASESRGAGAGISF